MVIILITNNKQMYYIYLLRLKKKKTIGRQIGNFFCLLAPFFSIVVSFFSIFKFGIVIKVVFFTFLKILYKPLLLFFKTLFFLVGLYLHLQCFEFEFEYNY